jgi:hypothetical protein
MGMARILVGLEFSKGVGYSIIIQKGLVIFYQNHKCEGIPFKCDMFHEYGHLNKELHISNTRKIWVWLLKENIWTKLQKSRSHLREP